VVINIPLGTEFVSYCAVQFLGVISNTKTKSGLKIQAAIDHNPYETGIKISKHEFNTINMERDEFHGEWNYIIKPTVKTP
jgi:hypothetical protein